ncbi:MAG: DUF6261 family protein [Prevotellaceae bacterium]|jgi:hypothetical protein|nr:DUF6261 family protein [Prevotellaceae bacterium]
MKATMLYAYKLNNGAHFRLISDVVDTAEKTPIIKTKLNVSFTALKKALKNEDEALKLSTKNLKTDQIKVAHAARTRLYSSIKKSIENYAKLSDTAAPAGILKQALIDYAIKMSAQRDEVSGMLGNLISDFQNKYAKEISTLGLDIMVANLDKANKEVIELMHDRTVDSTAHPKGALKTAREATDAAFLDFVETLNAHIKLEGDAAYAEFVEYLNAVKSLTR